MVIALRWTGTSESFTGQLPTYRDAPEDRAAIVEKLKEIIGTINPQIEGHEFPDLMETVYRRSASS
jgi:hypothetical protein